MSAELASIREKLSRGFALYGRGRAPSKSSELLVTEARDELLQFTQQNPGNPEAWMLLSQAEEGLMNFGPAIDYLERSMQAAGQRSHKDLKRLYKLREARDWWHKMLLSPAKLKQLGNYLDKRLGEEGCNHTMRLTVEWVDKKDPKRRDAIHKLFLELGQCCDCEILANLIDTD